MLRRLAYVCVAELMTHKLSVFSSRRALKLLVAICQPLKLRWVQSACWGSSLVVATVSEVLCEYLRKEVFKEMELFVVKNLSGSMCERAGSWGSCMLGI